MPTVQVQDLQHVAIDGVMVGSVVDAMANYRDSAADIQLALVRWSGEFAETCKAHDAAVLNEKLTKVTSDFEALTGICDQLKSQLKSFQQQAQQQVGMITENYRGQVEKINADVTAHISGLNANHQQQLEALSAERANLIAITKDLQVKLGNAQKAVEWQQRRADTLTEHLNHLLTGDAPAAVECARELHRLELLGKKAQLDAQLAAVEAASPSAQQAS